MGLDMVFSGITMFVQQNMTGLIVGFALGVILTKPKNGGQGGGGQRPPQGGQRPPQGGPGGPPRPPMGPGGFPR